MKLVLASTSAYRKMLLERLHLPFDTDRPETDETPLPGEAPAASADNGNASEESKAAAPAPEETPAKKKKGFGGLLNR